IKKILQGVSNDPIADRFTLKDGDIERKFFVGKFDGKANTVVLESSGKGYGGDVGLMIGVNVENDTIVGAGVTTHSETPGLRQRTIPLLCPNLKVCPSKRRLKSPMTAVKSTQ
ncbi:MAG: FMN-binding protein, partial [Deltaproteobacteria bacterium]|nr:FMN-binding protein [Deltaproteobacteria bacterium]